VNPQNLSPEQRESLALAISYMERALELLDPDVRLPGDTGVPQDGEGVDATRGASARLVLLQAQAKVYEVCNGGKPE
jgi:hypothetical protein